MKNQLDPSVVISGHKLKAGGDQLNENIIICELTSNTWRN